MTPPTEERRRSYDFLLGEIKGMVKDTREDVREIKKEQVDIKKDVQGTKTELAVLKVKSGLWGAFSGAITGLGVWFWKG